MNKIILQFALFPVLLFAQFNISPSSIKCEVKSVNFEEAVFYPAVFFAAGSDVVDLRFDKFFDELSNRLSQNLDIVVELNGYFHPKADGEDNLDLAKNRAINVRKEIINRIKKIDSPAIYAVVQPSRDPSRYKLGKAGTLNPEIQAENMLVEFHVKPMRKFAVSEILTNNYQMVRMLENNPISFAIVYSSVENWKNILKSLPGDVSSRVFFHNSINHSVDIHGDWVIRRPWVHISVDGVFKKDLIELENPGESFAFYRQDGYFIEDSEVGRFNIGQVDPRWNYYFLARNKTPSGLDWTWSELLKLKQKGREKRKERWFIANYNLQDIRITDEPYAIANRYLIAQHIIDLEKEGFEFSIELLGHTNSLEDKERSRQQSEFWAMMELGGIVEALENILDVKNAHFWLEDKGIKASVMGAMANEPSSLNGEILADNKYPEGRFANKRVEVIIKTEK